MDIPKAYDMNNNPWQHARKIIMNWPVRNLPQCGRVDAFCEMIHSARQNIQLVGSEDAKNHCE